jgi:Tfp pilus assembly protein PilW
MLSRATRGTSRGERGTSLLEVMVTASLTLVVLGAILGVFDTFVRAESRFERRIDVDSDLRAAAAEFARDARSGGTPWADDLSSEMAHSLTIPRSNAAGTSEVVLWSIDKAGTLDRTVIEGDDEGQQRQLFSELDTDRSKLMYFAADGTELVPGLDPADTIAGCAARVEMLLVSASGDLSTQSSARLRNASAEETC